MEAISADDISSSWLEPMKELSAQIRAIAKEYVDEMPKELCLTFVNMSEDTDEWIQELDDPFGLDNADELAFGYERLQEALDSGICHEMFVLSFIDFARVKYGLDLVPHMRGAECAESMCEWSPDL
jgi:hypothetical protein